MKGARIEADLIVIEGMVYKETGGKGAVNNGEVRKKCVAIWRKKFRVAACISHTKAGSQNTEELQSTPTHTQGMISQATNSIKKNPSARLHIRAIPGISVC